ncbi:MAG: phosphoribosylanthranilate isomerase [Desulfobulbus propionicus]|nr:MAG: phosphoribosylanthranilate isomerase [Desulfobulbus propionicus]
MTTLQKRTRIKICGITRLEDAEKAVQEGVDALGFVFFESNSRNIDPEEAKRIIGNLPPFIDTVGVFVDKKRREVEEIVDYCFLNYIQLHGEESPEYCERIARHVSPCQVLKAFQVNAHLSADTISPYTDFVSGFVLDGYQRGAKEGGGEAFDWTTINKFYFKKPYLLAGGLDPGSVTQALKKVKPYGVNVNSGVEKKTGVKDHELMSEFIAKVREYDKGSVAPDFS